MIEKMWKPSWLVKHTVPVNRPDTFNSSDGQIGMGVRVLTTKLPSWRHVSHRFQNCVGCMMVLCEVDLLKAFYIFHLSKVLSP